MEYRLPMVTPTILLQQQHKQWSQKGHTYNPTTTTQTRVTPTILQQQHKQWSQKGHTYLQQQHKRWSHLQSYNNNTNNGHKMVTKWSQNCHKFFHKMVPPTQQHKHKNHDNDASVVISP